MIHNYYTCPLCGEQVASGSRFCGSCGTELDWSFLEEPEEPEYQDMGYQQQWQQPPYAQSGTISAREQPARQKGKGKGDIALKKRKQLAYTLLAILGVVVLTIVGVFGILGGFKSSGSPADSQAVIPEENGNNTGENSAVPDLPVIKSFVITPLEMLKGDTATLSWDVSGATSVSIDQNIGTVNASGKKSVTPSQNTTYVLTATNADGSVTESARVIVNPRGMPVVNSFTVSPSEINSGQSVTLSWDVSDASKINILGIGDVSASGTQQVFPVATTTYTLSATNNHGITKATATVTMASSGVPTIVSFTADSTAIYEGQTVTLEWHVTGADAISLNNEIGSVSSSGTKVVSPTETTTYTLTATNGTGSRVSSIVIEVAESNQPLISNFSASPVNIVIGDESTLQWTVLNAASISISPTIGTVSASGTEDVSPTVSTTYTLTAISDNNTATKSVRVFVITEPVINSFTANPSTISAGGTSILSWNITGAESVTINQGIGAISGYSNSYNVEPDTTTIYTLTATNVAGSTTATVTVNVE